jgi:hypothetical protein
VRIKNEKVGTIRKWFLALLTIIMYFTIKYLDLNNFSCTGIYQEMRALEGGEPAVPTDMTPTEEEELLYGSEDDTPPTEEEAEKARKQAEKEAEEADMNAKQVELQERIRRRKAERKQRMEEQLKLEQAAMLAEQERLREEAEAEKAAHRRQIEKLEEQLRLARSGSGQKGEGGDGEDGEDEMDDDRPNYQKRDRSGSEDSRHESTASSTLGANCFNLPAGYKAVRSAKLNSLAVRHLNGGSAIPFKPIGSFTDEKDARIKLANTISDANSSRNISCSFNLETFICNTCTSRGEHTVLGKKIDGDDGTKQSPPCFVLSDQNFPAVIPVEGEGDCFKILLVENASLSDLTTVLLANPEGLHCPCGHCRPHQLCQPLGGSGDGGVRGGLGEGLQGGQGGLWYPYYCHARYLPLVERSALLQHHSIPA